MDRNKCLFLVVIIGLFFIFGCRGGQQAESPGYPVEEMPVDNTTAMQSNATVLPAQQEVVAQATASVAAVSQLPASAQEIQQALKNAGLYQGEIDGKIGPQTKKAIEDFQAKNNLKVDGKVGLLTWVKLGAYLNTAAPATEANTPETPQEIRD